MQRVVMYWSVAAVVGFVGYFFTRLFRSNDIE
jgi:hypothetical protein